MRKSGSGFTLVELLIVIVVIAILATISVIAYNGIQRRALNTARINTAQSAIKLLNLYTTLKGAYPSVANNCLGVGFPENKCHYTDSPTPVIFSTSFEQKINEVGTLPSAILPAVQGPNYKVIGPAYNYEADRIVDGETRPVLVIYWLDGQNQNCMLDNVVRFVSGNSYSTNNPNTYTYSSPTSTTCYVTVPNP